MLACISMTAAVKKQQHDGNYIVINNEKDLANHVGEKNVIVMVHKNGCPYCKLLMPKMKELAKEGHTVLACEQAACRNLVRQEKIHGFPDTLFYKKGSTKPHAHVVGDNYPEIKNKAQALS